jgi:hypothetical protein
MQERHEARKEGADHAVAPLVKSMPHALFWHDGAHGALTFLQTGHCQPFWNTTTGSAHPPCGMHIPVV